MLKENLTLGNFTGSLLKEYGLDQHIIRLSSINTLLALAAQDIGLAFASRRRVEAGAWLPPAGRITRLKDRWSS